MKIAPGSDSRNSVSTQSADMSALPGPRGRGDERGCGGTVLGEMIPAYFDYGVEQRFKALCKRRVSRRHFKVILRTTIRIFWGVNNYLVLS
jgi:hypothetical protein